MCSLREAAVWMRIEPMKIEFKALQEAGDLIVVPLERSHRGFRVFLARCFCRRSCAAPSIRYFQAADSRYLELALHLSWEVESGDALFPKRRSCALAPRAPALAGFQWIAFRFRTSCHADLRPRLLRTAVTLIHDVSVV